MLEDRININFFLGKNFVSIVVSEDKESIIFTTDTGEKYKMFHIQDCCEDVTIDDICGNLDNLINSPILYATEMINDDTVKKEEGDESCRWTFYKLATIKGWVDFRWYGTSNGYYSENVDIIKVI